MKTSNVTWFSKDKLESLDMYGDMLITQRAKVLEYQKLVEIYRQLKYAMNKQDNSIQALIFKGYEYHYYRKMLKHQAQGSYLDRFVLWTSLTNNFGQNWLKPIGLALPFLFVFYVLISHFTLVCDDKYNFGMIFTRYWGAFFQLLNPAHQLSNIYQDRNFSNLVFFFDFFQRIILSFFIFQTISAFRKFFKS